MVDFRVLAARLLRADAISSRLLFLLKNGLLMTVANLLGGLLGYAFQIFMGRAMGSRDFAIFSATMALTMFLSAPLGALLLFLSRKVSELIVVSGRSVLLCFYWSVLLRTGLVTVILLLGLVCSANYFAEFLKIPTVLDVYVLGLILAFMAVATVNAAFFQGQMFFGLLAFLGVLSVALKLVFSLGFVKADFGVTGGLFGVLLSVIIVWGLGVLENRRRILSSTYKYDEPKVPASDNNGTRRIVSILIANLAFVAMTQLDMVLVNKFFDSDEAGIYAAASVLGKAVLYLPGGIVTVLFPLVSEDHLRKKSSAKMLLYAVAATIFGCGAAALVYSIWGQYVVDVAFGGRYSGAGQLLGWYGWAMLPMALVMVAEYFLIAKGRVLFAWLFMIFAPLQIVAISFWHSELWMIICVLGVGGICLSILGYWLLWAEYKSGQTMGIGIGGRFK